MPLYKRSASQAGYGIGHYKSDPAAQEAFKKLPETLAEIRKGWAQGEPIRLMFQDEARFGRISDVRR